MTMHTNPEQCLSALTQQPSDGGRQEYLEQEQIRTGEDPERPTGDCAVVALVHASHMPASGYSYRTAYGLLWSAIDPRMYNNRRPDENRLQWMRRRLREWFKPPERNPMHMTPSQATAFQLCQLGYIPIFPNKYGKWFCICDAERTYVLDVQLSEGHTMTVHGGVAHTTYLFNPAETQVVNVYGLRHRETELLKAAGRYKKDEDTWLRGWLESDDPLSWDWDSRPKLGDYLVLQSQMKQAAFVVALPGPGLVPPSPPRPGQDEIRHLLFRPYQAGEQSAHLRDRQGYQLFIRTVAAPFSPCSIA